MHFAHMVFGPDSPEFAMMVHRYRDYPQLLDMFQVSGMTWDAKSAIIATLNKMINEMENCPAQVIKEVAAGGSGAGVRKRKR